MNSQILMMSEIFVDEDFNCRGHFNKIDVAELAQDIDAKMSTLPETLGMIQPVTVRVLTTPEVKACGRAYGLVAGFRRFFACEVLKRDRIPCIIMHGISPQQAAVINLSENIQRQNLNVLQEALAVKKLKELGIPRDYVAKELKVSSGWVQTRYNLLDLPDEIQKEAAAGLINQKQIKEIWSLKAPDKQFEAVRKIKDAKIKGEKDIKIKETKENCNAKKPRKRTEIFEMMTHLAGIFGVRFEQRLGSWCAGEISTLDLLTSAKAEADKLGLSYTIPPTGTIFNGDK